MELGADFTDGLRFRDGAWEIRLRPSARGQKLLLDANSPEAADAAEKLVGLMEQRLEVQMKTSRPFGRLFC